MRRTDTKERILIAAARLFSREGYSSTGMKEIGETVGITAGALYNHFSSKQDVLNASVERAARRHQAQVQEIVERELPPRESLAALIDNLIEGAIANEDLLLTQSLNQYHFDRELLSLVSAAHESNVNNWLSVLGVLRPELTESEMTLLVNSAYGAILWGTGQTVGLKPTQLLVSLREATCRLLGLENVRPKRKVARRNSSSPRK